MLHYTFNQRHGERGNSELTAELSPPPPELPEELRPQEKENIFQTKDEQEGTGCEWFHHRSFIDQGFF